MMLCNYSSVELSM